MNTKDIGNLGEHIALVELLQNNIIASRPLGDNSRYDLILDIKGVLFTCQIKSTISSTAEYAEFMLSSSQAHRGKGRQSYYVDCFILVDINKKVVFMLDNSEKQKIIFRYTDGCSSQQNYYKDYLLSTYLEKLP